MPNIHVKQQSTSHPRKPPDDFSLNCQEAFSAFPEESLFEWIPYSHSVLATERKGEVSSQGRVSENLQN